MFFGDSNNGCQCLKLLLTGGERSSPRGATAFLSMSVNWTYNLPIVRRTPPLSDRRPSAIFVANAIRCHVKLWCDGGALLRNQSYEKKD